MMTATQLARPLKLKSKRVCALYRVSTKGQVENDDIPMQKLSCEDFCKQMGWEIVMTFSEKGVSGYKVSAEKRDAIIDIREAAKKGQFDVLLVFMFDRLGRKEDETPFVVQWFINQGIEVWSVKEGQQKIEKHSDKLLNYLRYWQAEGESEKTSERVKTKHSQVTESGHWRGGTPPFGYKLEFQGRTNRKGQPLGELVINEDEASIVRTVFERYVIHGYGSWRICNYLLAQGMYNRKSKRFTNTTIQHMLARETYTGVLKAGEARSEVLPEIQIISPEMFLQAQQIMQERSVDYAERTVPLNTKGQSLLSGNVFCGHCGARLTVGTNGRSDGHMIKGELVKVPRLRYSCYNRTRHPEDCGGQTVYSLVTLDGIIEKIVQNMFRRVRNAPQDALIQTQFDRRMADINLNLKRCTAELKTAVEVLSSLEEEIMKVIQGKSALNAELVNRKYEEAERDVNQKRSIVQHWEGEKAFSIKMLDEIRSQYVELKNWAAVFSNSPQDVKKMIVSKLIRAVHVKRGYEVFVEFRVCYDQFNGCFTEESFAEAAKNDAEETSAPQYITMA